MSKQPWMKFYPSDWRADPKLRRCSLAARGLWIEMLGIMHEGTPYGHLVSNGDILGADDLAALVGADRESVSTLLAELEDKGVFSRKRSGAIFSRRMEADENKARKLRENGKNGGSPLLCKKKGIDPLVNQEVKPQIPEARSQRLEKNHSEKRYSTFEVVSGGLDAADEDDPFGDVFVAGPRS